MAVMMPREKWTDERLDDLNAKVDKGFTRVEGEIKRLDGTIERLDKSINRLDENLSELGREMNLRFEGLHRTLQAAMVAVIVALISTNAF
jgi:flagellar capping protein FliD